MASPIGKALGYGDLGAEPSAEALDEAPMSEEPTVKKDTGSAELMAMKMFTKATSDEAKVSALKAFLEACGAIGSDY